MNRYIRTIAITYTPHLTRAMALFASIIALSLFLYGIFLLEAVAHTATRTNAQREIATRTSHLSTLEAAYLRQTKDMTLERAIALGFVAPQEVVTVYASAGAPVLSLRH